MCWCITLEHIKTIVEIISTILGAFLGIMGISFIRSYRKKQLDSSFNFLSKLKIRVLNLKYKFHQDTYKEHILDALKIPKLQNTDKDFKKKKDEILPLFKEELLETLNFLMTTENQFPSVIGWTHNFNQFIEFIETMNLYIDRELYKWDEGNIDDVKEGKDVFYSQNEYVMEQLLSDINDFQIYIETKISKRRKTIKKCAAKTKKKKTKTQNKTIEVKHLL